MRQRTAKLSKAGHRIDGQLCQALYALSNICTMRGDWAQANAGAKLLAWAEQSGDPSVINACNALAHVQALR